MFTEKELNDSIEELKKLEDEISRIDAMYDKTMSMIPSEYKEDGGRTLKKDSRLDKIVREAQNVLNQGRLGQSGLQADINENSSKEDEPIEVPAKGRRDMQA